MNCPSCKNTLSQYKYHGTVVDVCRNCKGMWFDPGELKTFIDELLNERAEIPDAAIDLDKKVLRSGQGSEFLKLCPHCREVMKKFNYAYDSNIILDRCPGCAGVWTDGGELHKLAVHRKGNPHLRALGESMAQEQQKARELDDLIGVGGSLPRSVGAWYFLPKIILPLGDDIRTAIFPGVVFSIIGLNAAVFAWQVFVAGDAAVFFREFGVIPSLILEGKGYYSLLTHMFLHGGVFHVIGNMFFFWIFGDNVEEAFGHLRFLVSYILFGLLAAWLHILTNMGSDVPAIGASGAVAGVMGAYLVRYPHAKIKTLFFYRVIDVPAYLYLGGWIGLQVVYGMMYLSMGVYSGVAWFAHIGGFVSGMLLMWGYKVSRRLRQASYPRTG